MDPRLLFYSGGISERIARLPASQPASASDEPLRVNPSGGRANNTQTQETEDRERKRKREKGNHETAFQNCSRNELPYQLPPALRLRIWGNKKKLAIF